MLQILELVFVGLGLYLVITGKLPQSAFRLLFGSGDYEASPTTVRLLGLILMAPLPVALCLGVSSVLILGEDGVLIATFAEIGLVIFVAIAAVIIVRRFRVAAPETTIETQNEDNLARLAQGSAIYAFLGLLGPVGFIMGPLAFLRGRKALQIIEEQGTGQKYKQSATIGQYLGGGVFILWTLGALALFIFLFAGLN